MCPWKTERDDLFLSAGTTTQLNGSVVFDVLRNFEVKGRNGAPISYHGLIADLWTT